MSLFKQLAANQIQLKDFPFFSELNIEAFILENPQIISSDDISNPDVFEQQLTIQGGRKTGDGRIDLMASTDNGYLIIIEIKNGSLSEAHLEQIDDYLNAFDLKKFHEGKFSDYELIGLLVGTDITPSVKEILVSGRENNYKVIGLTIKRFKTLDGKEIYSLTEFYQPKASAYTRYGNWKEFEKVQNQKNIPKNILKIAKTIHDDFITEFKLSSDCIKYTPTTFTLSIPKQQRKRVFAYIIIRKKDIKIYLVNDGEVPIGAMRNEKPERYPDSHYILLNAEKDYTSKVKKMIKDSFNVLENYYE